MTPEQQLLIVRWFIKTIIMYEFLAFNWPPPAYFDDHGFGLLMSRWKTLVIPP
jgi:hypothetical protein